MFKVENHRLEGVTFESTDNMGGEIVPEYVVIHYTATSDAAGPIRVFRGEGGRKVSAHLVVDKDGTVTQMVPFNRAAWHAGRSQWAGRSGCNQFTVGIEIVNPGFVEKASQGYVDWASRPYQGEVVEARHKNSRLRFSHWAAYTPEQILAVTSICLALFEAYPMRGVVGHDDIAPGRKFDPGPAFPLQQLQSLMESRADDSPLRYVTTTQLNLRAGAGVGFGTVEGSPLASQTEVDFIAAEGDWYHVITPDRSVEGWAHGNFLRLV